MDCGTINAIGDYETSFQIPKSQSHVGVHHRIPWFLQLIEPAEVMKTIRMRLNQMRPRISGNYIKQFAVSVLIQTE